MAKIPAKSLDTLFQEARLETHHFHVNQVLLKKKIVQTVKVNHRPKSIRELVRAIRINHMYIGGEANAMIGRMNPGSSVFPGEVDLVAVTLTELTGKPEANYFELLLQAKRRHLVIDSIRFWLNVRLQYNDQPSGECLHAVMDYDFAGDGCSYIFSIENEVSVGKWLAAKCVSLNDQKPIIFPGDSLWLVPRVRLPKITT